MIAGAFVHAAVSHLAGGPLFADGGDSPSDIDPTTGKGPEWGEAAPVGLLVIVLLCIALYFLVKSMNRNLKKVPASFEPASVEPVSVGAGGAGSGASAAAGTSGAGSDGPSGIDVSGGDSSGADSSGIDPTSVTGGASAGPEASTAGGVAGAGATSDQDGSPGSSTADRSPAEPAK